MNNKIVMAAVAALVVGGGLGFFGGVKYQQSKTQNLRTQFTQRATGAGGNLAFGQAQGGRRGQNGSGFVTGSILSKDEKSLTIKSMDGGSKIVYYSQSTQISKPAPVQVSDLNVGDNVLVAGSAGSDGSITAQTIQFRSPLQPTPTPSK